jgi:hypothetical protein
MRSSKPTVLLEHHLKELKLPTMLQEYASVAGACSSERADYPTYLLRLCERELIDRERRAAERRIKAAKFPVIKTLDSFDFTAQPSINESLVRELMSGQYIQKKENVLLVGNSGTGKTHVASALAFAACAQGRRVRFFTVGGLVTALLEAREERQLERMFKHLQRQDLLVLDSCEASGYVELPSGSPGGVGRTGSITPHNPDGGVTAQSVSSHSSTDVSELHRVSVGSMVPTGPALAMAARLVSRSTSA